MSDDSSSRENSREEPKRYTLQWVEGTRPDDEDMLVEPVSNE